MELELAAWTRLKQLRRGQERTGESILIEPAFLCAKSCAALVACFRRNRMTAAADTTEFFRDRVLWASRLPAWEVEALAIIQRARAKAVASVREHFHDLACLEDDGPQLVEWPKGMAMPTHADNAHPDGAPHPTPWRKYAVVVYLNHAFRGGELYFATRREYVEPKTGLMVAFHGSEFHGVAGVRDGTRYTMPLWLREVSR